MPPQLAEAGVDLIQLRLVVGNHFSSPVLFLIIRCLIQKPSVIIPQTYAKKAPQRVYGVRPLCESGNSEMSAVSTKSGLCRMIRPLGSIKPEMPVFAARANATRFSMALKTTIEKCW